ncbi:uncharacterized protein LOC103169314 [Ornithorhynchus anatinus]|uniref:uncharacterized protein LOC103169314 n=1 Tax=Ornithorhynchus anatinus TaxID=9258 RepID=UPI00045487F2|nr:uncharacterized protein LOC103169314 [Ornithorhynchus anatinus]XP_039768031.1 uncharacterized protein LOC103169314 [Ornithorhynchus anatinus]XP_039768032.1 uncharacterized protein LOC103169314 [Ornithorhynchus anatinus]
MSQMGSMVVDEKHTWAMEEQGWTSPPWDQSSVEAAWRSEARLYNHFKVWQISNKTKKGKGKEAFIGLLLEALRAARKSARDLEEQVTRWRRRVEEAERDAAMWNFGALTERVRLLEEKVEPIVLVRLEQHLLQCLKQYLQVPIPVDQTRAGPDEDDPEWARPSEPDRLPGEDEDDPCGIGKTPRNTDLGSSPTASARQVVKVRGVSPGLGARGAAAGRPDRMIPVNRFTWEELVGLQERFRKQPTENWLDWLHRLWRGGGTLALLLPEEARGLQIAHGRQLAPPPDAGPTFSLWDSALQLVRGIPWEDCVWMAERWSTLEHLERLLEKLAIETLLRKQWEDGNDPMAQTVSVSSVQRLARQAAPGLPQLVVLSAFAQTRGPAVGHPTFSDLISQAIKYWDLSRPPVERRVREPRTAVVTRERELGRFWSPSPRAGETKRIEGPGCPRDGPRQDKRRNLWRWLTQEGGFTREQIDGLPTQVLQQLWDGRSRGEGEKPSRGRNGLGTPSDPSSRWFE